jgi:hypothetical protein
MRSIRQRRGVKQLRGPLSGRHTILAFFVLALAQAGGPDAGAAAQTVVAKDDKAAETKAQRKPTLLPAAKRRTRASTPPPLTREDPSERSLRTRKTRQAIEPAPLPPARDPPGDRGPPLGLPPHLDPRWMPATPPIGYPPLPPARQVPGEKGIPLGPGPLSPVR